MNTNIFKKHLLTLILILFCGTVSHATDDLITQQITIKLDEAGYLPNKIADSKKYKIINLKIVGEINGTDLLFIREMAGSNYKGNSTSGNLSILDLSEAKIVKGGDYYIYIGGKHYTTSNNELGVYTFYNCDKLNDITIPSSVTSIGISAFSGCSGLTNVTIPSSVTSIGAGAFSNCSGLTSITIPSSVTSIGEHAFSCCRGLTSVTISPNVKSIGDNSFSGCNNVTVVKYIIEDLESYLPEGHVYLSTGIYYNLCEYILNGTELTNLIIPEGVTSIGKYAFYKSKNLTNITIPSSVTSIGDYAFYGCSGLTSVTIPSSVTSIGDYAFGGCSGLTSVTIPSSVTSIDDCAFSGCSGLTSITFPSSVSSIGDYAFSGCSGLTSIYVYAEKVPTMGNNVFKNCDTKQCTLYVPKGTYQDYWISEFGYFENIVEFDATGIDKVSATTELKEVSRYSANGQRLSEPAKGLNIVKYSDGSVKKVAVQ